MIYTKNLSILFITSFARNHSHENLVRKTRNKSSIDRFVLPNERNEHKPSSEISQRLLSKADDSISHRCAEYDNSSFLDEANII